MNTPIISASIVLIFLLILPHSECHNDFLQCLNNNAITNVVTPNNSSFMPILESKVGNRRFIPLRPSYPLPQLIVTPVKESQVPRIVVCAKKTGMHLRTRSGGNEFNGISYTARYTFSGTPFVILDLRNLKQISINAKEKTLWVQTAAGLGEVYYRISQTSRTLAFPGGNCPSVCTGGYFSGGGYTVLLRMFGMGADNVVDARIVDVRGRILDRKSMGEDLFWAIRGGGGGTFGVVTAWKLGLVTLPEKVTVFSVKRTLEQNMTQLMHKWQYVHPKLPHELTMFTIVSKEGSTIQADFKSYFLGSPDALVELLQETFPELGVTREDCSEVSWVQVALFYAGYSIHESPEVLKNPSTFNQSFLIKTDYIEEPIPEYVLERLWKFLGNELSDLTFAPHGGRMAEIPETALPIPHRNYLFTLEQKLLWDPSTHNNETERYVEGSRRVYEYMTPFASKSPRAIFVNYRDLDVGVNNVGYTSYAQAKVWGEKYYKKNFQKLALIKGRVDPENFFRHEQSVPPHLLAVNEEVEDDNRAAE